MSYKPVMAIIVLLILFTAVGSAVTLFLYQSGVFD
jgi:hypothetical protein